MTTSINGSGITFPDSTTQTTAAVTPYYTGTDYMNLNYPVGSYLLGYYNGLNTNTFCNLYIKNSSNYGLIYAYADPGGASMLNGTWSHKGGGYYQGYFTIYQRIS